MERTGRLVCAYTPCCLEGASPPGCEPAAEPVCGACRFFHGFERSKEAGLVMGRCRLGVRPRLFACDEQGCAQHQARPHAPGATSSAAPAAVVAAAAAAASPLLVAPPAAPPPAPPVAAATLARPADDAAPDADADAAEAERLASLVAATVRRELERDWIGGERPLHPRFAGGRCQLVTEAGVVAEFPLAALFRRLRHLKGTLANLEQALDDQDGFTSEERAALTRHLRGIEGSFTTFNLLFADREDGFRGTGQR
ncbi:MAG: hypothetical protein RBU45_24670 [Myxococcota bacterium]|jgi:hypothetical protein|nr:hypothetical protein [Myxococcota bacterium]